MSYPAERPTFPELPVADEPFQPQLSPAQVRQPFNDRIWWHVFLFVATLITTTMAGASHYAAYISEFDRRATQFGVGSLVDPAWLLRGLWYSGTLLAILGAHEMGHYLYCRRHRISATLPFFLPMPPVVFLTGTLGAVIKIRAPFPTKKVLFDVGVAGPIAGFVLIVPALFYGLSLSNIVPAPTQGTVLALGEPLLFRWGVELMFGTIREGYTVNMHPMVFAAWFGMLATALNLLPFGQLDGGHITYATMGRASTWISLGTVAGCVLMTLISTSWMFITIMMLGMLFFLGPRHPRVIYEDEPLGIGRVVIAILALVILILCFTPTPIEIQDLIGSR